MTDVFICGAGPVGLTLGIECLRRGMSVRLVDRMEKPADKSRALGVWSATMEALDRMGCSGDLDQRALRAHSAQLSYGGKILGTMNFAGKITSRYNELRLLAQTETEDVLRKRLEALGGSVEYGTELLRFSETDGLVNLTVRHGIQAESETSAKWLVGCDGAHSVVRHGLGLEFHGTAMDETFLIADVAVEPAQDLHTLQIDWQPASVLAVFPIRDGMLRLVISRNPKMDPAAPVTMDEIHDALALHGRKDWKLSRSEWLTSFRINERLVDTYRIGKVLLAGDAAHIHSPAGGQGMNTGIQDAVDLGWRLGLLARGCGNEDLLLSSYSEERRPVAQSVLRDSTAMTRLALTKNPILARARNVAFFLAAKTSKFQTKFARSLCGLDLSYSGTPLIDDDQLWPEDWLDYGTQPGNRVPEVPIFDPANNTQLTIHDLLNHTGHTLVLLSGRRPSAKCLKKLADFERVSTTSVDPDDLHIVRIWRGKEVPDSDGYWFLDNSGEAHWAFAAEAASVVLIRPDARVALRSSPPDTPLFEDYAVAVFKAPDPE